MEGLLVIFWQKCALNFSAAELYSNWIAGRKLMSKKGSLHLIMFLMDMLPQYQS
jgi:hypothetical protein